MRQPCVADITGRSATHDDHGPSRVAAGLTASRLSLAARCPEAFVLPHFGRETPEAARGTAIHAHVALLVEDGLWEPEREEDPGARAVLLRMDPAELRASCAFEGASSLRAEVPFALDPTSGTARVLPPASGGHRDYSSAPEGSVCGTADAVAAGDGRVLVTDFKTGSFPVAPPETNPQLGFLALAAARAHGAPEAAARIVHVDPEGRLSASTAEFSPDELERVAREVRGTAAAVGRALGRALGRARASERSPYPLPDPHDLTLGSHCRVCPASPACPATAGAARSLVEEDPDAFAGEAGLTPEAAARAWEALQGVEAAAKRARAALADYVAGPMGGRIDLPSGGALRIVESRRDRFDPARAMPVLRAAYGDGADAAVSVSKTGLKRLAGAGMAHLMAELESAGAVEVARSESLREVGAGR